MFVYELSGCGFESSCSHLNFIFRACFEQGVPWHSGNYRVRIHSKTRTWRDKNIQSCNTYVNGLTIELFSKRNMEYNLRNYREWASHRKLTRRYDLEIVNYKPSQIWKNVPMEIENSGSLEIFKLKIKSWTAYKWQCWVCK